MPIDNSVEIDELDLTPVMVNEAPAELSIPKTATSVAGEAPAAVKDERSTFYASLPVDDADRLRAATCRITAATGLIRKNMLVIGLELNTVSSEMPGHFEEWLRLEFSMSRASAYHYMNVAAEFADVPTILDELPATTIYKLAARTTPAEVRDAVVREIAAGERISAKDVKERISDAKAKPEKTKKVGPHLKKQENPHAANDDVKTTEVVGPDKGQVAASPLPGEDTGSPQVGAGGKPTKDEQGRTEHLARETLASLRRHLPAEVLETLMACSQDHAAWRALGNMLTKPAELIEAA